MAFHNKNERNEKWKNEVPKLQEKSFEICQKLSRILEIPFNIQRLARSDLLLENQDQDQDQDDDEGQVFRCSGQEVKSHLYVMGQILLNTEPPSEEISKVRNQIRQKLSTIADLVVQTHLSANFIHGQLSKFIKILESELNRYPGLVSCLQYMEISSTSKPSMIQKHEESSKNTKITYFLTKLLLQTKELVKMVDHNQFQDFQEPLVEIVTLNKLTWLSKIQIFNQVSSELEKCCQNTVNLVEKSSTLLANGSIKEDLKDLVKNLKTIRKFGFRGSTCSSKLRHELNKVNFFIRELQWILKVGIKFDQFVLKTLNSILGITLSGSSWKLNLMDEKKGGVERNYLSQTYKYCFRLEERPKFWISRFFRRMTRSLGGRGSQDDLIVHFLKDAGNFQEIFELLNFGKFVALDVDLPQMTLNIIYEDILKDLGRVSLYYTSTEGTSEDSTQVEEAENLKTNTITQSFIDYHNKIKRNIPEISTIFEKPRRELIKPVEIAEPEPPELQKIVSLEKLFERIRQISTKTEEDSEPNLGVSDLIKSSSSINVSEIQNKNEIIIKNNTILELG